MFNQFGCAKNLVSLSLVVPWLIMCFHAGTVGAHNTFSLSRMSAGDAKQRLQRLRESITLLIHTARKIKRRRLAQGRLAVWLFVCSMHGKGLFARNVVCCHVRNPWQALAAPFLTLVWDVSCDAVLNDEE